MSILLIEKMFRASFSSLVSVPSFSLLETNMSTIFVYVSIDPAAPNLLKMLHSSVLPPCVTIVSVSLRLNGTLQREFMEKRRLQRQKSCLVLSHV